VSAEAHRVREAGPDDVCPLALMLRRAFHDDPIYRWLVPRERQWERNGQHLFACYLRQSAASGTVLTTPEREGAALWVRPSAPGPGVLERLRSAAALLRTVRARTPLALRAAAVIHRHHLRDPHWYLSILGTEPPLQGLGIGSALMRPVLERCDAEGRLAFVKTATRSTLPLYEQHGFAIVDAFRLPAGGPEVWCMVRRPQAPDAGGARG
jgi:GNAT superfamily N-acetyltransferase